MSDEPERNEEYFERGHSSPHNPPPNMLTIPTAEEALADLAKILGTDVYGERVLDAIEAQIWDLLRPYIASEDGPDYSEANMEVLCADVLPKVWDLVRAMDE